MASTPHITVKVDSSQVQRLIQMADDLRKMSDDLREVIREHVTVKPEVQSVIKCDETAYVSAVEQTTGELAELARHDFNSCRDDPDAISPADSSPIPGSDLTGVRLTRTALKHTGTMKLTREMKLVRDDPDAIQDEP